MGSIAATVCHGVGWQHCCTELPVIGCNLRFQVSLNLWDPQAATSCKLKAAKLAFAGDRDNRHRNSVYI